MKAQTKNPTNVPLARPLSSNTGETKGEPICKARRKECKRQHVRGRAEKNGASTEHEVLPERGSKTRRRLLAFPPGNDCHRAMTRGGHR